MSAGSGGTSADGNLFGEPEPNSRSVGRGQGDAVIAAMGVVKTWRGYLDVRLVVLSVRTEVLWRCVMTSFERDSPWKYTNSLRWSLY